MMDSLKFSNNWRRILCLTSTTDRDIDVPVSYVMLNVKALPMTIKKFCSKNWANFGFDYDAYSYLIWPSDDGESTEELANRINNLYSGAAKIIKKTAAEAHGIDDTLNFGYEDHGDETDY